MLYEDVKAKCLYCETTIEGNQKFMLGGKALPGKRGRVPQWLKERPEHQWIWNGLSAIILGQDKSFDFYLCPLHQSEKEYHEAFEWAQKEIDGQKALTKLVI